MSFDSLFDDLEWDWAEISERVTGTVARYLEDGGPSARMGLINSDVDQLFATGWIRE